MDLPPAWSQTCICGRTFSVPQAYTYHQRSCLKTKKRLSDAIAKARVWRVNKRQKTEEMERSRVAECSLNQNVATELLSNGAALPVPGQVRFYTHLGLIACAGI